jgi:hypothetical protein
MSGPVYVEEPEPGGLEPAGRQVGEAAHELEPEPRVVLAFGAHGVAVQGDGPDRLDGPRVELPLVRSSSQEKPATSPAPRVWTIMCPRAIVAISSATLPSRSR